MQVYPSDILPLVRTFLTINGYATTVAALDKELAKNKVAIDKDSTLDLLEACRAYMQEVKAKAANGKEKRKAEDEGNSKEAKKAKVEKKKKESDSESSDDEKDKESSSGSESSSDSESDSDSSSSSSSDSDSESDSSSDSDSSDSGSDSDSESSGSESSSEEETKKAKKDKKEKKDKKDKKEKKEKKDKKEESANGTSELPTTPKSNGYHTPAVTPTGSSKKNTPFRRVTEDDVSLLDNKFADNTFESKQGDEYGRKANEILSQVRGNKFRSEKGKKKKSYRSPGVIDTRINSVKFVYDE